MVENVVKRRLVWGETDAAGVAFYPNYFKWFDICAHELFRKAGLPLSELERKDGIIVPVLSASSDFHAALIYDDEFTITSAFSEFGKKTLRLSHVITRERDRLVTTEGSELRGWGKKDKNGLHLVTIPDNVRKKLA